MTGDKRNPPLDVRAFREAIGKRLGIEPFGQASIASMGDVLRTTWRRYEDGSKPIPSTVTKLVVYHAILDELADLDGDDAARALGVPYVPPDLIGVLRDHLHDTWQAITEAARDPRREEKTTADPIPVK